jgi:hypothetical protein
VTQPLDGAAGFQTPLSQTAPTEYHADLVVLLRSDNTVYGIVIEVQLNRLTLLVRHPPGKAGARSPRSCLVAQ